MAVAVKLLPAVQEIKRHWFDHQAGKIPWKRAWQPTPVFLHRASHGQRSLAGYSPSDRKESETTEATYHTCTYIHLFAIFMLFMLGT